MNERQHVALEVIKQHMVLFSLIQGGGIPADDIEARLSRQVDALFAPSPVRLFLFGLLVGLIVAVIALSGCAGRVHSFGHSFKSDPQILAQLVVGETSPEAAVRILEGEPYMRQNLHNGTIAWHWKSLTVEGAGVGVTDNRRLVLQFTSTDGGKTWRFRRVMYAHNIDLPEGMPFGSLVK